MTLAFNSLVIFYVPFNPFVANVPILYLLKTPENPWFFLVYSVGIK